MYSIPPLKIGSRVHIVSPAGAINPQILDSATATLIEWGCKVTVGAAAKNRNFSFAGSIDERFNDFQEALNNPNIDAILCGRGGYGAIQLIEKLDWTRFSKHPKWIIGFSDITNFHAILACQNYPSIHATMAKGLADNMSKSAQSLKELLFTGSCNYNWQSHCKANESFCGVLTGGNLSILYSMLGNKFFPNLRNKILFLEDLGEHHYHIDRMMYSLRLAGALKDLNGIVLGSFSDMKDQAEQFGSDVFAIVTAVTKDYNIPIVQHFKAGHQDENWALPFGLNVSVDSKNGFSTLRTSD